MLICSWISTGSSDQHTDLDLPLDEVRPSPCRSAPGPASGSAPSSEWGVSDLLLDPDLRLDIKMDLNEVLLISTWIWTRQ